MSGQKKNSFPQRYFAPFSKLFFRILVLLYFSPAGRDLSNVETIENSEHNNCFAYISFSSFMALYHSENKSQKSLLVCLFVGIGQSVNIPPLSATPPSGPFVSQCSLYRIDTRLNLLFLLPRDLLRERSEAAAAAAADCGEMVRTTPPPPPFSPHGRTGPSSVLAIRTTQDQARTRGGYFLRERLLPLVRMEGTRALQNSVQSSTTFPLTAALETPSTFYIHLHPGRSIGRSEERRREMTRRHDRL